MQLMRDQQIEVRQAQSPLARVARDLRSFRGRTDLFSWAGRLTRNASVPVSGLVRIKLFGVPDQFADFLGLRAG